MYLRSFALSFTACATLVLTACGGDDTGSDVGPFDSGVQDRGPIVFDDAMPRPDASARDATPALDAALFCVENNQIQVEGTNVPVDEATDPPTTPNGLNSSINTCIAQRPTQILGAPIRYRGCVSFMGAAPTQAELDQLDITAFRAEFNGERVDPSFDPVTGADRAAGGRLAAQAVIDRVAPGVCASGLQLEIGRNSIGGSGILTDFGHHVRIRSATTAANPVWMTTYYFDHNVRGDELEGGGDPQFCDPQQCSGRFDVVLIRRTAFAALVTASGANIPGAADLSDYQGSGHALLRTADCQDIAMTNATGGFAPPPTVERYLTPALELAAGGATATSTAGMMIGLGFTHTSSSGPATTRAAVAVRRSAACSEQFAGGPFYVYPDSMSVFASGRENTLN